MTRRPSIAIAALLLLITSACSQLPGTQADAAPTESSPSGQPPADPPRPTANPGMQTEYAAIKRLVGDREKILSNPETCEQLASPQSCEDRRLPQPTDEPVNVFDCGFTDGIDVTLGETEQPAWSLKLLEVAKLSTALENAAAKYDYPDEAWKPKLRQYEAREIERAAGLRDGTASGDGDEFLDDPWQDPLHPYHIVDTDMHAYRSAQQPALRELRSTFECGAGESPVLVRGEPKASRIRLIPGFFSDLCQRTQRPLDGDDCPYWFEVTQERPMDLAGRYRYEASWPGGGKAAGTADIDKLHTGDDEEYAELVIRDPGAN
jgi:hypothetical protein